MTEEVFNKLIINATTGEQEIVPMTEEEVAQLKADQEAFAQEEAARVAAEEAKAEAKASAIAKLAALGLTEEEAAAIAGA